MANKAATKHEPAEAPLLVRAETVARELQVSLRQVGYWAEQGRIPCHRLGRRCVRYSLPDVLDALGIKAEASKARENQSEAAASLRGHE